MDDLTLKRLQETEYGILCMIDDFCKDHDIKYSLYAGTALGAVRHGGFIPWDDDIDITMTRTEFDRFCRTWSSHPVAGYYLESILTDDHCGTCHAKLRKEGTLFLSNGEIEEDGHHGIWVDIFPLDIISLDKKIRAKKYKIGREIILLSRANVDSTIDSLGKKLIRTALRIIPRAARQKRLIRLHQWLVDHMEDGMDVGYEWKDMCTFQYLEKFSFLPDLDSGYITIRFNDRDFSIFENYEDMLVHSYGDYMQLPPESERVCKHDPIKMQF